MKDDQPAAPSRVPSGACPEPVEAVEGQRSFSLNSREFYEAVTPPPDPWVWAGGLPREPRPRDPEVVIEREARKR